MKTQPLRKLADRVGRPKLAAMLGVDLSTIYLWIQRENDPMKKKGRRPGLGRSIDLAKIAAHEGIKSLTVEYLARL